MLHLLTSSMWPLPRAIAYIVNANMNSQQEVEQEDTGTISVINFYLPAFKFQCSCWGPKLISFQMYILSPNWDSILAFAHNQLHLKGHASSHWPIQFEPSVIKAGLRTETSEYEPGVIVCIFCLFVFGSTAHSGPGLPHSRGFWISHTMTHHSW
jgi:hypothetical protein